MINGTIKEEKIEDMAVVGDLVMKQISIRRFIMKLKIIGNLIITIILVIIIDFFVSKVFKSEFSVYQDILTGIIAYIGGYFTTRKKN